MADRKAALLGLGSGPHGTSVDLRQADLAGALAAHVSDLWNAAMACGAPSLAVRALPRDTTTRPQSRSDLRLLRSFAKPSTGALALGPRPVFAEYVSLLPKILSDANPSFD